jgi:hypothetical protein
MLMSMSLGLAHPMGRCTRAGSRLPAKSGSRRLWKHPLGDHGKDRYRLRHQIRIVCASMSAYSGVQLINQTTLIRERLKGYTEGLEDLAIEMLVRLSVRDIECI